ncbi:40S ribosomal protein S2-2 [Diplonema papillatum]|nr:40S ribosomal protein S2-2 [Diplonema papillatum]
MADAPKPAGKGGFGRGRRGRRGGRGGGDRVKEEWMPVTKLGRLVKDGRIRKLEEIYLHSLPIKEPQIIDHFFKDTELKDEVMKIMPVQKATSAGERTRFKAFVVVGDSNGHIGLGVKCSKEVANAMRSAIVLAKLALIPVRRGYWGTKLGAPHTVPCKVTGKCGSVRVRLIPAPKGTGLVGSPVSKKLLSLAGVNDCFTCSIGQTKTMGNFVKAVFAALGKTYGYLTPDLWEETRLLKDPYQEHSDFLANAGAKEITA